MKIFDHFYNGLRTGELLWKDQQYLIEGTNRIKIDKGCVIGKIMCVSAVVCIVALAALAIFSGSLLGILGGVVCAGLGLVAAHDGYKFFSNLQYINKFPIVERVVATSKERFTKELSKGMICCRLLVEDFVEDLAKRSKGST